MLSSVTVASVSGLFFWSLVWTLWWIRREDFIPVVLNGVVATVAFVVLVTHFSELLD